jgi:hypothetical protein
MLGLRYSTQPNQMPHALSTSLDLPSLTSWPRRKGEQDQPSAARSRTSAWLSDPRASWSEQRPYSTYDTPTPPPRLPLPSSSRASGQLTPPSDMSNGYRLADDAMGANYPAGNDLSALRSFASSVNSFNSTAVDPSFYHYSNSLMSNTSTKRNHTPDSQRTYNSQNDSEHQMSPSKLGPNANLNIPETIQVPQDDLSELAAEVRSPCR